VRPPVSAEAHRRLMTNPYRASLTASWNDDWARRCADPDRGHALVALLAASGADLTVPMAQADATLAALVGRARTDDEAARIVLQRVLPGLVVVAARRSRQRPDERRRLFDDLVANAWCVIRTYPLERRPTKIAVNILRDAEYLTCVRPSRLRSSGEIPMDEQQRPEGGADHLGGAIERDPHPAYQVALLLNLGRRAGLPPDDARLLERLHLAGERVEDIARDLGVTTRTVRNRRHAATQRLAVLAAA